LDDRPEQFLATLCLDRVQQSFFKCVQVHFRL
jgi:hypothetical protein